MNRGVDLRIDANSPWHSSPLHRHLFAESIPQEELVGAGGFALTRHDSRVAGLIGHHLCLYPAPYFR